MGVHLSEDDQRHMKEHVAQLQHQYHEGQRCFDSKDLDLLAGAYMHACNFVGAEMSEATLTSVKGSHANFSQCVLARSDMQGAYFAEAFFCDADLSSSNLKYACFNRAYLVGANLRGCDLTGVDFMNAYLDRADFHGAYFKRSSKLPLPAKLLGKAKHICTDLRGYQVYAIRKEGGGHVVLAGCRFFFSLSQAREHWNLANYHGMPEHARFITERLQSL